MEPEAPPQERTDGRPGAHVLRVEGEFLLDVRQCCEDMSDDGRERRLPAPQPRCAAADGASPCATASTATSGPAARAPRPRRSSRNDAARMCREAGRRPRLRDAVDPRVRRAPDAPYPWLHARRDGLQHRHSSDPSAYDREAVTGNDREAAHAGRVERVSQARPSGAYARCVCRPTACARDYGQRRRVGRGSCTGTPFQKSRSREATGQGFRARRRPATRRRHHENGDHQIGLPLLRGGGERTVRRRARDREGCSSW